MRRNRQQGEMRDTRFPFYIFFIIFGVLLLMSGIHTGLIVFMNTYGVGELVQTIVPIGYWGLISLGLTLYTRNEIKNAYEEPMHKLADATQKVAEGDFSVYIAPTHTSDKLDYIDMMILNFDKMVEELGSIETLKTDFVSNVSHEMKTPIAVIKNSAQMLRLSDVTEEERKEYIKNIENASNRLSALITNILKLNRLEHQKITTNFETYDVCRQICDCVIACENRMEEKQLELEIDLEDEAIVRADEELMELVWNNLLSNAIKFTDKGGTIRIKQTIKKQEMQIEVTDSGCGMSKESITHIFDKFYQGDTSRATEGNGLGLALVYRVLQLMDGKITVESEVGKGSTFTVILPQQVK